MVSITDLNFSVLIARMFRAFDSSLESSQCFDDFFLFYLLNYRLRGGHIKESSWVIGSTSSGRKVENIGDLHFYGQKMRISCSLDFRLRNVVKLKSMWVESRLWIQGLLTLYLPRMNMLSSRLTGTVGFFISLELSDGFYYDPVNSWVPYSDDFLYKKDYSFFGDPSKVFMGLEVFTLGFD